MLCVVICVAVRVAECVVNVSEMPMYTRFALAAVRVVQCAVGYAVQYVVRCCTSAAARQRLVGCLVGCLVGSASATGGHRRLGCLVGGARVPAAGPSDAVAAAAAGLSAYARAAVWPCRVAVPRLRLSCSSLRALPSGRAVSPCRVCAFRARFAGRRRSGAVIRRPCARLAQPRPVAPSRPAVACSKR